MPGARVKNKFLLVSSNKSSGVLNFPGTKSGKHGDFFNIWAKSHFLTLGKIAFFNTLHFQHFGNSCFSVFRGVLHFSWKTSYLNIFIICDVLRSFHFRYMPHTPPPHTHTHIHIKISTLHLHVYVFIRHRGAYVISCLQHAPCAVTCASPALPVVCVRACARACVCVGV